MELSPSPGFSYALQSPVTRTVELPQPAGLRSPYSCPSLQKRGWTHAGREHRPPLRTFRRCWGGVWSSSAPGRQPGRFLSLPLHAQTSAKAGTQTSSQCTSSTVRASALMVVPMLYAQPLELSPAGACISTLPAIDTTHPLPTAAPPHPRPELLRRTVSAVATATKGWCGDHSPGARRAPRASHPAAGAPKRL